MDEPNWNGELDHVLRQVRVVRDDVESNLRRIYDTRALVWDGNAMTGLSGDIHSKVLGAYLKKALKRGRLEVCYEVTLSPTKLRADILIDGKITIESKAQGIFSLEDLKERWRKLVEKVPNMEHILVSWNHNASYVRKIREFIPESHHYYFHDLSKDEDQPQELGRLVRNLQEWLRLPATGRRGLVI